MQRRFFATLTLSTALTLGLTGCTGEATPTETITIGSSCSDAMSQAASVGDLDNDAELKATVSACGTYDEWRAALQNHPGAGSLTDYSNPQDAADLVSLICQQDGMEGTPTCADAKKLGTLNY